jgi:glycosyltransferase involved in cell wall biosynthesis
VWTHNLIGLGFLIFILFKKKKYRHLHTIHDIQLLHPSGLLMWGKENIIVSVVSSVYQEILKSYLNTYSTIISPSQWLLDIHKQQGFFLKNKSLVIPNPVKTEVAVNEKICDSKRKFTFVYVGQIEHHKGINLLLDAFRSLTAQDVELVVVGDGLLLYKLINNNNDSRITFKGRQTSEEVMKIMNDAHCLVVPSLCYENYPTVILEARLVGLPVIGSNFGGIKEMIKNDNALFSPTINELSNKLSWCLLHRVELKNIVINKKDTVVLVSDYIAKLI